MDIYIYIINHNYRRVYVALIKDKQVIVYENKSCKINNEPLFEFEAKNIFIGDSRRCSLTENSDCYDDSSYDGNTILLEISDYKYVYISGREILQFETNDKIIDYMSLMGNNQVPTAIGIGDKNTYFISDHYKFIANDKISENTLLKATNITCDPYYYHLNRNGLDSFTKLLNCEILHSIFIYSSEDEDEDEDVEEEEVLKDVREEENVVKIYNQKCVICMENDSVYIFKKCGHLCLCDNCYNSKHNDNLLKCFVC